MLRDQMITILKITAICNAILMGWAVTVDGNRIILRKKIDQLTDADVNVNEFIEFLLELN